MSDDTQNVLLNLESCPDCDAMALERGDDPDVLFWCGECGNAWTVDFAVSQTDGHPCQYVVELERTEQLPHHSLDDQPGIKIDGEVRDAVVATAEAYNVDDYVVKPEQGVMKVWVGAKRAKASTQQLRDALIAAGNGFGDEGVENGWRRFVVDITESHE